MKKYYLEIGLDRGSELVIGSIPTKIFNFIHKKYDGDIDEYFSAVEDGIVPEEFQWISYRDLPSNDDIEHIDAPGGVYAITLRSHDDPSFERELTEEEIDQQTVITKYELSSRDHFVVWEAVGERFECEPLEIEGEFDLTKLQIHVIEISSRKSGCIGHYVRFISYGEDELGPDDFDCEGSVSGEEVSMY